MEEATPKEETFVKGGFGPRQARTLAAAFGRIRQHPADISTLKWAAGLAAVAIIAGFGWQGSEIREIRSGLESRMDRFETRMDGLAIDMARVQAILETLNERQGRLEALLDPDLPP